MASSRLRRLFARIAPLYPGEGPIVLLCLAVNFLVVAGLMFGRNARDSLFLLQFGVEYLPYMYFANAVVLVVCSLFYTSLVDRIDRGKLLAGVSLIFVTLLVASRMILSRPARWFYPVLYILAQAVWNFSLLQFWTFLGEFFDTRQAKRLIPLIGIGGLLGMIGVGLTSRPLVKALGTENILLVWAGLLLAAVVLGGIAYRNYRMTKPAPTADHASAAPKAGLSEWQKLQEGFSHLRREPLLRTMALVTFLLWTVFTVVDFSFNKVMRQTYPDKNVLTAFLGSFRGIAGFLCLVVQLFLTSTLISRLGLGTTIAFHPLYLSLSTLWMTVGFGYVSVYAAKMGDHVLLYTVQDSSFQLLYNPVPPEQRARIRGLVDGYVKPLSMAAAGVLLLLGNRYLSLRQIAVVGVVLSVAWLGASLTAKKGYIRALLRNLQGDSPSLRQAAATALSNLKDPASLTILSETLQSENPARVITAVQFLESFGTTDAKEAIAALLAHSDAGVRATAASALGRLGSAEFSERLIPLLNDPDPRVRANTIEALATTRAPALIEKFRPLLQDPSTRTRINTVLSIAAIQGVTAAIEWLPFLRELAHGDRTARSTATFALGQLPLDESMDLLSELLKDRELEIRCEAAEALGRIGSARIIPDLVEALAGPAELRHFVRRSLAAIVEKYGAETTQELVKSALASDRPEIRSELADVLGRLKDARVIEALMSLLRDPEWRVRWKVLKSFGRLARAGPLPQNARVALFNYAREELANFRQSLIWSRTLVSNPNSNAERVLALALEEDRAKIEERVFNMLGIICGRDRMIVIYHKLNSTDARLKADALEALDNLAPRPVAREVLQLLEPPPAPQGLPSQPAGPLLRALTCHPKPWIRACTVYYLGHHPQRDGESLLKARLADPDRIVRETALYAGWLAFDAAWQPQVDAASQSPDDSLRRAAQKILRSNGTSRSQLPTERSNAMLLTVEKVLFLKSAPLFACLEGEELAALADIALEQEYTPGEIVFREGQVAHHLYVVVRGKVEVFHEANSREHPIAVLGEKECFGELAILDDEPRSATVRAVEPTLTLKIDHDSFCELIHERPQISFAIFKILSHRLRQKNLEAESVTVAVPTGITPERP